MNRLFVAVWPPAELVGRLRALDRPERPGLRWTTADQWHVTLRFLGDVDDAAPLAPALAGATVGWDPILAAAGPRPERLGDHVWALPVTGLAELAAAVAAATSTVVPVGDRRPFHGHLTLARAKQRSGLSDLAAPAVDVAYPVDEITLVRSELRSTGARYQVVDRWALGAG